MVNRVTLAGFLVGKPKVYRSTTKENARGVCKFSLGSSLKLPKAGGGLKLHTYFARCIAFGRMGENLSNWMERGDLIYLEGHLVHDRWVGRDGKKRALTLVHVDLWHPLITRKWRERAQALKALVNAEQEKAEQARVEAEMADITDEDVPE